MTAGFISSFQSLGTVDGPGVRYVVFLQGCPLRCKCCHNPETWDIGKGDSYSADEIAARVSRYRNYFGSDGGITISGGEPLLQAEFVAEVFRLCKAQGISTCLDTSGCILDDAVQRVLDHTDLVLLDYKMTNEADYFSFSGMHLQQAERFLRNLNDRHIPTWLRQVILCGINDTNENISALFQKQQQYDCIRNIELLPFRKLCTAKYEQLGIPFPLAHIPETPKSRIDELLGALS